MKEGNIIEKNFGYMLKNRSSKLRSERERIPSFYCEEEDIPLTNWKTYFKYK